MIYHLLDLLDILISSFFQSKTVQYNPALMTRKGFVYAGIRLLKQGRSFFVFPAGQATLFSFDRTIQPGDARCKVHSDSPRTKHWTCPSSLVGSHE